jgi:hypothetical protein
MQTEQPSNLTNSSDSPSAMATPMMTTTRFAVLATDWVVAEVFLIVIVESSL